MTNFLKRHLLTIPASLVSLRKLISYAGEPVVHIFYHTVSDDYLPHIHPLYQPKNISAFTQDIDFMLRHFQAVSIHDVRRHALKEKIITQPSFHLSFDDGLREVYDVVLPVLSQKGVPATVFVNSAFVDNKTLFYRHKEALSPDIDPHDFLKNSRPYLTTGELRAMQAKGFTIGAHSIDHPRFSGLDEPEQIRQTLESCAFVKEKFGEPYAYFSFPFSDTGISDSFFKAIVEQVELTFGTSGIYTRNNGRHLGRIDMENYGENAKQCIQRAYMTKILKRWIY
jgi:peptidoglycan/xylan/chitin deacetylase (PgdA/CDA1 family)